MATILKNNIKPSGSTLKGLVATDASGNKRDVKFVRQVNASGVATTVYDTFDHYEYSDITITANHTYNGDVGANGSGVAVAKAPTYKQTRWSVGASGAKYDETTLTSGATITYSGTHVASNGTVSGSSLGTTVTARNTSFASSVATVTMNGKSKSTSGVAVAQAANAVTNSNYQPSGYVATCSIGSGLTAAGGSATITASAYHDAYNYYTSGSKDANTHRVNDTANLSIVTNGNNRFSLSGTTLSHTSMGQSATTDNVTVRCTNASNTATTKDASTSVTNTQTAVNDGIKSYGTPTVSIGSGLTAAGGSATITRSVTNVRYWHYTYTSGNNEAANARTKDEAGTVNLSIVTNGNSRFSLSGTTLSHTSMAQNVTTDNVTVRATNAGSTTLYKDASTSVTNTQTKVKDGIKSYGTPTCSIGSGITAGGGSATVSHGVTNVRYYHYTYTSGNNESANAHYENEAGTTTISIVSNGNNRFSLSGNTITHTKMGTNTGTDTVTVRAVNSGSTSLYKDASASATNTQTKNAGAYKSYGTPTISIGSGITAGGGSATITASVTDVKYYYYTYTDTSANEGNTAHYENVAGSVSLSIASQTASRYSISGTTLSHTKMGTTTGTDSVTVRATNTRSTSLTKDASTSVTNTATVVNDGIKSYGTPSVSIGSGITAGGGSATITRSVTNVRYWHYTYTDTSANEAANARTKDEAGTVNLSIASQTASRYSISGTTLSHTKMGTTTGTDSVTVRATNAGSTNLYKDASTSVTNTQTKVKDGIKSYGTPTCSIGSGITANGGSATVSHGVTNVRYYHYTYTDTSANEAANAHYENETGSTTISITSNGNNRFSLSGNTLSHSSMTTNVTTDSVTVRAVNSGSTSLVKDASTSVTNTRTEVLDGIKSWGTPSVSIGSGITAGGGSATITRSVTNVRYYHYTYTASNSNESANAHYKDEAGTVTLSIASQTASRYSISGTTLSHTKMGTTTGDDSVTVRATNAGSTSLYKDATTKVTNTRTKNNGSMRAWGTPTVSIGTGMTAAGGSATVSHSVTNSRYWYYTYTDTSANESTTAHYEDVTGNTTIAISSNGNSRFSLSGNTLSHSSMGASATTDTVKVKATNSGDTTKTAEATSSLTNAAGTQHYKNTSGTTGDNWTYGTPSKPTLTNNLTAKGGTVSCSGSSVTNTKTYYLKYTSGSYGSLITENPAGSVAYEISSNGNSRFSISGTTVSHSSMTTNATTDTVGVKAYNTSDSSKKSAEATASVTNSYTDSWNNPVVSAFGYATSSFAYGGGTSAAPNSKTASQSGTRTFTSGSTSTISNSTFTWSYAFTNQPYTETYNRTATPTLTQWRASSVSISGYKVYESNSNYNVNYGYATTVITIKDNPNFYLYINSYAESSYDYTVAFNLDQAAPTSNPSTSSTGVKASTSSNQKNPSSGISSFTKVEYPNDGGQHTIVITYRKDGSGHSNNDRGYVAIPNKFSESFTQTIDPNAGFTVNASTGVVTAATNAGDTRSCSITATATGSGSKSGTKTFTFSQLGEPSNGYEYVDLGLPSGLKWAKCNVGAASESYFGLYFAWGATKGYDRLRGGTAPFTIDPPTSYDAERGYSSKEQPSTLDAAHDAVTLNMGGGWHMPDRASLYELINNTTLSYSSGINTFTKNNATVTFADTGYYYGSTHRGQNDNYRGCYVWSREAYSGSGGIFANILWCFNTVSRVEGMSCPFGLGVRGVISL